MLLVSPSKLFLKYFLDMDRLLLKQPKQLSSCTRLKNECQWTVLLGKCTGKHTHVCLCVWYARTEERGGRLESLPFCNPNFTRFSSRNLAKYEKQELAILLDWIELYNWNGSDIKFETFDLCSALTCKANLVSCHFYFI